MQLYSVLTVHIVNYAYRYKVYASAKAYGSTSSTTAAVTLELLLPLHYYHEHT
jgi:hypothetical protein